ncbi:MAG: hypothetical protein KF723_01750 [Rhizobiaceae bacterium]|nr:hypothetical protein [Rhizobiaceae bacterium]
MTGSIPHLAFDSAALPEDRQFAAWAGAVAAYAIEQIEPGAFPVRAESWQIDCILLTRSTVPPVRMRRDAALIRQEGSDLYAVQLMLDGRWTGLLGTIPVSVEPGDAILIDRLARWRAKAKRRVPSSS